MAFLRLIPFTFLFVACVQEDPKPDSRAELFAGSDQYGKTWQITSIDVDFGTVTPNSCVTDNFITYYPNGNYEINEGATKCNPNDPPGEMGTWTLSNDESQLTTTVGDSTQVWVIDETLSDAHRITSTFSDVSLTYTLILSN